MKKKFVFHYPNLIIFLITLISLFILINQFEKGRITTKFWAALLFLGISWFIFLIDFLLKLKISSFIYIIYFIFIILTVFFGYLLNFYLLFPWYRRFSHFLGGVFTSILGLFIVLRLDNIGYLKFSLVLTYSIFFSGFTISLWSISAGMLSKIISDVPITDLNGEIIMGLIGTLTTAIFMIFDNTVYHNRYLEKLLRKLN